MAKSNPVTIIFEDDAPLALAESLVTVRAEPRRMTPTERQEAERIAARQGLAVANEWIRTLESTRGITQVGYGSSRMSVLRAACLRGLEEFAREREAATQPQARPHGAKASAPQGKARAV